MFPDEELALTRERSGIASNPGMWPLNLWDSHIDGNVFAVYVGPLRLYSTNYANFDIYVSFAKEMIWDSW